MRYCGMRRAWLGVWLAACYSPNAKTGVPCDLASPACPGDQTCVAFGGGAFTAGTARQVEDYAGAALWLPPGSELDEAAIGASLPSGRESEFAAVFEAMTSYHPQEPHWYLPLIGVDPARHRKGYGAALLQDTLRRCDQDYVAAYLESTNPANITLYQRHGFELRGTIQVGSAPPLFPMLRPAR